MYWLTEAGDYYEGDRQSLSDQLVTQRPSPLHVWQDGWTESLGPVPEVLTPAQFWMQIAIDGDEAAALAIIDTLPRPQQILATKAKDYRIDDPLLLQLAAALGKNESQIDAFFRRAVKL